MSVSRAVPAASVRAARRRAGRPPRRPPRGYRWQSAHAPCSTISCSATSNVTRSARRSIAPRARRRRTADLAAGVADHVVVMVAAGARGLVAGDVLADLELLTQADAGELVEHAVDDAPRGRAAAGAQLVLDLVGATARTAGRRAARRSPSERRRAGSRPGRGGARRSPTRSRACAAIVLPAVPVGCRCTTGSSSSSPARCWPPGLLASLLAGRAAGAEPAAVPRASGCCSGPTGSAGSRSTTTSSRARSGSSRSR